MSKLEKLIEYYRINRQVGHTTLALQGLTFDRPAIILVAHNIHVQILVKEYERLGVQVSKDNFGWKIRNCYILPISWLMGETKGLNLPIIVEHYALDVLFMEHEEEVRLRIKKLGMKL